MIINDEKIVNQLIAKITKYLSLYKLRIPKSVVSHVFARSQGFQKLEHLIAALPIVTRQPGDANYFFKEAVLTYFEDFTDQRAGIDYQIIPSDIVSHPINEVSPFPIIAESDSTVYLGICWLFSLIYKPRTLNDSEKFRSFAELLDRTTSLIPLNSCVTKNDYFRLKKLIQPVLDSAQRDEQGKLVFQGDKAWLLNDVRRIIQEFKYEFPSVSTANPRALYEESIYKLGELERARVTCITRDDAIFIHHSSSDLQLRQLVASEILQSGIFLNDMEVLNFLENLRDRCFRNYVAIQTKSAEYS